MTENAASWFEYIRSPHSFAVKKYLVEMLKERYTKHDPYISRLASTMNTDEDVKGFSAFIADVYEAGFMKAYSDYREELKKLGYGLQVVPENSTTKDIPSIFPQEKSG